MPPLVGRSTTTTVAADMTGQCSGDAEGAVDTAVVDDDELAASRFWQGGNHGLDRVLE